MNGTFVNAKELQKDEERLLADGDALAFGNPEPLYFVTDSLYQQLAGRGLAWSGRQVDVIGKTS